MGSTTVSLCAVYIPSPLKIEVLETYVNNIKRVINKQSCTILIGDFNIPTIHWTKESNNENFTPDTKSAASALINDFMAMTNLSQYNGICNSYGKTLDFVFSNYNLSTGHSNFFACPVDKYHPPLIIYYETTCKDTLLQTHRILRHKFLSADYDMINGQLSEIDWEALFQNTVDINEMTAIFYKEIRKVIENCIPKKM